MIGDYWGNKQKNICYYHAGDYNENYGKWLL